MTSIPQMAVDFSLMLPRLGVSDKREAPASLADGYPRVISLGRKEEVFAVTGAARHLRRDALEPGRREIAPVDEGVDEPNGIVGDDIIVDRLWQQQKLRTCESRNVSHIRF
jgi:hypothetical protein